MFSSKVELFREPSKIVEKLSGSYKSEMTEWQLGFLCGLIKEYQPKKILEIGVAAGGTTAVILNCISALHMNSEMHSIDLSEQCYHETNRQSGYLINDCKRYLENDINHKLHLGKISVNYLDEIGDQIDFLILDTAHILPGEVLDFLACLPLLKKGAIVVLHDIRLNHDCYKVNSFATKQLLDTVVAEKILTKDPTAVFQYPSIGAFRIIDDTYKYIENVFSALTITWQYLPSEEEIEQYRNFYARYYDEEKLELFDFAVKLNKMTLETKGNKRAEFLGTYQFIESVRDKEHIFIYGNGLYGTELMKLLEAAKIHIEGYVVSDDKEISEQDESTIHISDLPGVQMDCTIIVGSIIYQQEICRILKEKGYKNIVLLNKGISVFLERER